MASIDSDALNFTFSNIEDNLNAEPKNALKGVWLACVSCIFWALSATQTKYTRVLFEDSFNDFYFASLRSFFIYAISHVMLYRRNIEVTSALQLKRRDLFLFRVSLNYLSLFAVIMLMGIFRTGTVVCIMCTCNVFVMIFSVVLLNSPIQPRFFVGFVICFIGTYIIMLVHFET